MKLKTLLEAAPKMKIADVRRVIDSAGWALNDLSGHTREEFAARDVPAVLAPHEKALKALEIPDRYEHERSSRDSRLAGIEKTIARWKAAQPKGKDEPRGGNVTALPPRDGKVHDVPTRHVVSAQTRHGGGNVFATHLTLADGQVLVVTDEHVLLYPNAEAADRGDPEDVLKEFDR
jgi:hypothetical protein